MEIRVLGSCGSRLGGCQTSSFLINGRLLLDAGTIASVLSLEEQIAVEDVLLTHAHLDHVADLPFLIDNVMIRRAAPLRVWAPAPVLQALQDHLFNDILWPDFTRLPSTAAPALQLVPLEPGAETRLGALRVRWTQTRHPVPSAGYCLTEGKTTILFSGDTAPTEDLWNLARSCPHLKAAFIETTFPDRLSELAMVSGHLTPASLQGELEKLARPAVPVKVFHAKAQFLEEILAELNDLHNERLQVLGGGEEFSF